MSTTDLRQSKPQALDAAIAQLARPFTAELIVKAGIKPGMRVLNLGCGAGDVAFQVADRVGISGFVAAYDLNAELIERARARADEQCLQQVSFHPRAVPLSREIGTFDAVICRAFLANQRDPVNVVRLLSAFVRRGGVLIFQEFHWSWMLWTREFGAPAMPLCEDLARRIVRTLRRHGTHVNMGLHLAGALLAANLPLPSMHTHLQLVAGANHPGLVFLEECVRAVLPADGSAFVDLRREMLATGGHFYLPMQVGAAVRAAS